jgi:osmotically-inducible protein OsmY
VLFISLIAISLAFLGCDANKNDSPYNANGAISEAELEKLVESKLDSDPELKAANLTVNADAERNEVTLLGSVDSPALRSRAVELAKSARPGLNVKDEISVEQREPSRDEFTSERARSERDRAQRFGERIGESIEDAWIHAKIVAKLVGDPDAPARKINVDVVDSVVTLRGTVDTAEQKAEAERIARTTDGVKSVNNQLKVATAAAAGKSKS